MKHTLTEAARYMGGMPQTPRVRFAEARVAKTGALVIEKDPLGINSMAYNREGVARDRRSLDRDDKV
jgi:hypothetical protein